MPFSTGKLISVATAVPPYRLEQRDVAAEGIRPLRPVMMISSACREYFKHLDYGVATQRVRLNGISSLWDGLSET